MSVSVSQSLFSRLLHPVEFSYILEDIILDRVTSIITDLGVVMDSRMSFSRHIDVTVAKALAMLRFVKILSGEFMDPYTIRTLYVSLVRPKFEIERVQKKLDRCAWIRLGALTRGRYDAYVMLILLSFVNVTAPCYRTRGGDFLRIDFHRNNYGVLKPLIDAVRH
jgi:hypothetical protein